MPGGSEHSSPLPNETKFRGGPILDEAKATEETLPVIPKHHRELRGALNEIGYYLDSIDALINRLGGETRVETPQEGSNEQQAPEDSSHVGELQQLIIRAHRLAAESRALYERLAGLV